MDRFHATVNNQPGPKLGVADQAGNLRFSNRFFLDVEPSLFGSGWQSKALTVAEIRLHLRDSGRAENHLLDALQFDDAEIMACIRDPIDYWNSVPPMLGFNYTTQNFPHRWQWKEAAISRLYKLAAVWYRKNHLTYQAGGVAVDDLNKADEYDREGDKLWDAYVRWTTAIKASMNADQYWGTGNSPYGVLSGWGWY